MNFEKLGGRRYVMCMGCAIVSTGLLIIEKLTGGEFVTIISITVGAYIAGNTTQKIGAK